MTKTLRNEKTAIGYDEATKQISGDDFTDQYNMPAFYSKSKRGIAKAWATLEAAFTPETTMYEACRILSDNGIRTHSWCTVD